MCRGATMIESAACKRRGKLPRPFNTPLECGLRLLFVLAACRPARCDLQRLISYDYLLVHSGDVENGPESLHPAVPDRGAEWVVKRDLVQTGMDLMFARELVTKQLTADGITYVGSEMTSAFIGLLKTPYATEMQKRAGWIVDTFGTRTDDEVQAFMAERVGAWGTEFETLAAIGDIEV